LVHRARASFRKAFAGLAGEGFVAPANLALALPVLTVPAALQVLPPLPAALAPPHAAAAPGPALTGPAGAGLDPSSVAGPVGAGLIAKLAAAAGTKAAIVAGGAAIVVGGGLAVRESRHDGVASGRTGGEAPAALVAPASHEAGGSHHGVYGGALDAWAEHRHAVAEHLFHREHGSAHHLATDGHSSAAAPHSEGVHEPAHSSTGITSTPTAPHSEPSDTSTPHEGDSGH
jgi:hypothetical protein